MIFLQRWLDKYVATKRSEFCSTKVRVLRGRHRVLRWSTGAMCTRSASTMAACELVAN